MAKLTPAELRDFITSPLTDPALQILLDAAYEAIEGRAAPTGEAVEIIDGLGLRFLTLGRSVSAIGTIVETYYTTETELETDDWLLRSDGVTLERLVTGTNPSAGGWTGRVTVTYTPESDSAERNRAAIELCKLDLNYNPGITSETIGTWTEQHAAGPAAYQIERDAILDSLFGFTYRFA